MDMQVAIPRKGAIDRCIEILQLTEDGNRLSPAHLYLVQAMTSPDIYGVTEAAEIAFDELHRKVVEGRYDPLQQRFYGIEHMTRDHEGYVLWRGKRIEHYSFRDAERERAAAEALAARCRSLEERRIPINGRTVIFPVFDAMPADSPYLPVLLSLYTVFANERGLPACLIVSLSNGRARALSYDGDTLVARDFDGCYEAYHGCSYTKSFTHLLNDYAATVDVLATGRFTPGAIAPFLL